MGCRLVPSTTHHEDFTAPIGETVTIAIKGPDGTGAEILHLRYGTDAIDSAPPLQFTVAGGALMLVVLVEASIPGALLQLVERFGPSDEQVIDRFHFDPMNPARGYIVRGV